MIGCGVPIAVYALQLMLALVFYIVPLESRDFPDSGVRVEVKKGMGLLWNCLPVMGLITMLVDGPCDLVTTYDGKTYCYSLDMQSDIDLEKLVVEKWGGQLLLQTPGGSVYARFPLERDNHP